MTTVCKKVWVPNVVTKEVPVTVCKNVVEEVTLRVQRDGLQARDPHSPGQGLRVRNGYQDPHRTCL